MKKMLIQSTLAVLGFGCVLTFVCTPYSANAIGPKNTSQKTVDAEVLFDKHCDTCHGKDGRAKTFKAKFNHARNLTDAKWQALVSDERLFNSISNGKGKMPAFGKKLSETQINSLVTFVRSLKK